MQYRLHAPHAPVLPNPRAVLVPLLALVIGAAGATGIYAATDGGEGASVTPAEVVVVPSSSAGGKNEAATAAAIGGAASPQSSAGGKDEAVTAAAIR